MNDAVPFQLGKRLDDLTLLSKSSLRAHLGMRDLGALQDCEGALKASGRSR